MVGPLKGIVQMVFSPIGISPEGLQLMVGTFEGTVLLVFSSTEISLEALQLMMGTMKEVILMLATPNRMVVMVLVVETLKE
jgi:hypothetical protein